MLITYIGYILAKRSLAPDISMYTNKGFLGIQETIIVLLHIIRSLLFISTTSYVLITLPLTKCLTEPDCKYTMLVTRRYIFHEVFYIPH